MSELVKSAEVNQWGNSDIPYLVLDGEPFPYVIDARHGMQVLVNHDDVNRIVVSILVDGPVAIKDRSDG